MTGAENQDASLPSGRERTDKSLSAERAKTDRSLAETKKHLERHADEAVLTSREEADETRSRIRSKGDRSRELETSAPGLSTVDEHLQHERRLVDDAIDIERSQVDRVFLRERSEKQIAENELLREERAETDRDLTSERNQTDSAFARAANALAEEMNAHLATRTALTTRKELLAIVSHDLKNPLASISMAVDLLKASAKDGSFHDTADQYMDLIGRNAQEGLRLISDLLDMERMAAGKLAVQVETHDITEIVEYSFKTFQHQASDKKFALIKNCRDTKALVLCDRDRIIQVLSNLTSNALKFTAPGGTVELSVSCRADEVQVSVSDNGPGIPESMQEKIFERFWQVEDQSRHGLGLGLYISRMIVEAHRGRIWVESKVGAGSTFHFTLPVGLT